MTSKSILFVMASLMAGFACEMQGDFHLNMPPSVGELEVEGYWDYIEAYPMKRLRFTGCLTIDGDPIKEFYRNANGHDRSALELEHYIVNDALIHLWVYPDSGKTAYTEEGWNELIEELLENNPRRLTPEVLVPFENKENSGPPILGYVAMQSQVRLTDPQTGVAYHYRFLLVPAKAEKRVLLVSLVVREEQFAYMNGLFDGFVRSLYLGD